MEARKEMTKRELVRLRRSLGLCLSCGDPLETEGKYYVKCEKCRRAETASTKEYRMAKYTPARYEQWKKKQEAQEEISDAEKERRIRRCTECEWVRLEGAVAFCPFAQGICMKGDFRRYGNMKQGGG